MVPKSHCPVTEGGPIPKLGGIVPITRVTMPMDGPRGWHRHPPDVQRERRLNEFMGVRWDHLGRRLVLSAAGEAGQSQSVFTQQGGPVLLPQGSHNPK